jgi:hypothetical protein
LLLPAVSGVILVECGVAKREERRRCSLCAAAAEGRDHTVLVRVRVGVGVRVRVGFRVGVRVEVRVGVGVGVRVGVGGGGGVGGWGGG